MTRDKYKLPYTTVENHQQNVFNFDDVVQKDFFSVDFHKVGFKKALYNFIDKSHPKDDVSKGIEISNNTNVEFLDTHCTYCHACMGNAVSSFLDVNLLNKIKDAEDRAVCVEYQDWLLSYSADNPWAAAITQLVVLRDEKTKEVIALFQPTVQNHPDRALFSNFIIAFRQLTECSRVLKQYKYFTQSGLDRKSAIYIASFKHANQNHTSFCYTTVDYDYYFSDAGVNRENKNNEFSMKCSKICWGNNTTSENIAKLNKLAKESERNGDN